MECLVDKSYNRKEFDKGHWIEGGLMVPVWPMRKQLIRVRHVRSSSKKKSLGGKSDVQRTGKLGEKVREDSSA